MTVANPIPANSAKSTKGTVHCLICPRNRGMEATCCCCWGRGGRRYHLDLGTVAPAGPARPSLCIAPLIPG
ncbi:hypothetical protein E2C01_060609 [Portunus trituberculatus]|uniref:Uncharacterized protein n=1 Tax=Portunus trituberculatus TaxID=210409 RepID=A0A5B7H5Y8_PORTR|nr:hypothetical protein [Portunus trituberculatus]